MTTAIVIVLVMTKMNVTQYTVASPKTVRVLPGDAGQTSRARALEMHAEVTKGRKTRSKC